MTPTLSPPRRETVDGLIAEYASFADLLDGLSGPQWKTGTRCTGWEVRDAAGHVFGGVADTLELTIGTRTADEQARAYRDRAPADLARDLREDAGRLRTMLERLDDAAWLRPSPVPDRSVGEGVLSLWHDTFVHADDIRAALGLPSDRGPGLEAALRWLRIELERRGWGPARLALDGLDAFPVGVGGPELRGDPLTFLLVGTGREDPAVFGVDAGVNVYA
ncbi:hypothetical protein GCM10010191_05740 [Actinomadura vinacea]|uniref:Mycothiol-dependent maleylpyruvate isomerase metal-binding domain-containing protein n=1 Tax=Actinomadura vinacea TaxID=115336 RepID=A0ABN3IDI0_9ACTN